MSESKSKSELLELIPTDSEITAPDSLRNLVTLVSSEYGDGACSYVISRINNGYVDESRISSALELVSALAAPKDIPQVVGLIALPVVRQNERPILRSQVLGIVNSQIEVLLDTSDPTTDSVEINSALSTTFHNLLSQRELAQQSYMWRRAENLGADIDLISALMLKFDSRHGAEVLKKVLTRGFYARDPKLCDALLIQRRKKDFPPDLQELVAYEFDDTVQDSSNNGQRKLRRISLKDTEIRERKEFTPLQFITSVQRLIRRSLIQKQFDIGETSLEQIVKTVRQEEREHSAHSLPQQILSGEDLLDPDIERITVELSEYLLAKFPNVRAIVLLGSLTTGGAKLREAMGHLQGHSDYDWGIIGNLSADELYRVVTEADAFLSAHSSKSLVSCGYVNPQTFNVPSIELATTQIDEMLQTFSTLDENGKIDLEVNQATIRYLIMYFNRSYPTHVNELNQKAIAQRLALIQKSDPVHYHKILRGISTRLAQTHAIKAKHTKPVSQDKSPKNMMIHQITDRNDLLRLEIHEAAKKLIPKRRISTILG